MDIFSLPISNKLQNPIFESIIADAKESSSYFLRYPPHIQTIGPSSLTSCKINFLIIPWPSWNEYWTRDCISLCAKIYEKYPNMGSCHYPDVLNQVKFSTDASVTAHIAFFDVNEFQNSNK